MYFTNSGPAKRLFTVTPSDTLKVSGKIRSLLCTVAGNVAVQPVNNTTAETFVVPVVVGQILPLQVTRVLATGTTATVLGMGD